MKRPFHWGFFVGILIVIFSFNSQLVTKTSMNKLFSKLDSLDAITLVLGIVEVSQAIDVSKLDDRTKEKLQREISMEDELTNYYFFALPPTLIENYAFDNLNNAKIKIRNLPEVAHSENTQRMIKNVKLGPPLSLELRTTLESSLKVPFEPKQVIYWPKSTFPKKGQENIESEVRSEAINAKNDLNDLKTDVIAKQSVFFSSQSSTAMNLVAFLAFVAGSLFLYFWSKHFGTLPSYSRKQAVSYFICKIVVFAAWFFSVDFSTMNDVGIIGSQFGSGMALFSVMMK